MVLLRFHGHGTRGIQGLTDGKEIEVYSEFNRRVLDTMVGVVARLRSVFHPFGSAELHGCQVGAGSAGDRLLQGLCTAWGVPVSAGVRDQEGGDFRTFRFEGPTVTACPHGVGLKAWASALPEQAVMSVNR